MALWLQDFIACLCLFNGQHELQFRMGVNDFQLRNFLKFLWKLHKMRFRRILRIFKNYSILSSQPVGIATPFFHSHLQTSSKLGHVIKNREFSEKSINTFKITKIKKKTSLKLFGKLNYYWLSQWKIQQKTLRIDY